MRRSPLSRHQVASGILGLLFLAGSGGELFPQDFFGFFGGFERPAERYPPRVRSYAPESWPGPTPEYGRREPWARHEESYARRPGEDYKGRFGAPPQLRGFPGLELPEPDTPEVSAETTYCVRLCDGRYFALPAAAGAHNLNPRQICAAFCPAAKTQVFSGPSPEQAIADDGARYEEIDTAFAFRTKLIPNCSCTGHGPGGLAQIDIASDPTLRSGDVVITASGPAIFKGANRFPYKQADFTPVKNYGKLNAELRKKLSGLRVDPTARAAPPVVKFAPADDGDRKNSRERRRRKHLDGEETREASGSRSGFWPF